MSFSSTISCLLSLLKTSSGRSLSKSWLNCAQLCAKLIFLAVAGGGGLFQVALNTVLLPSDFFCPLKSWLTHQLSKFIAGQKPAGKNGWWLKMQSGKEKGLPQWFLHHKKREACTTRLKNMEKLLFIWSLLSFLVLRPSLHFYDLSW